MGMMRLFLALCVVAAHTSGMTSFIGGREAVLLFYIISGFYMSLILNEKYTGEGSTIAFYKSRYLRLWVPYIVVMLIAVPGYMLWGNWADFVASYQSFPPAYSLFAALSNIFIFGQDLLWLISQQGGSLVVRPMGHEAFNGASLALNGPLFSVGLELYFYLLAPFVLRGKRSTFFFALLGLSYHLILRKLHITSLGYTYHFFPATIAYFGIGASLYHLSQTALWQRTDIVYGALILAMTYLMNSLVPRPILMTFIIALPFLFAATRKNKIDRLVGELSYGVYIIHLPVLAIVGTWAKNFWGLAMAAIGLSLILHFAIERPLTRYREKLFVSKRSV